jgi:uncharacterized protein (TIGR03382 family)
MNSTPFILTFGLLLFDPRPSEACTCPPPLPFTFPADGAVDVPTDVVLLAGRPLEAFRLVQGDVDVTIAALEVDGLYEIRPAEPLAPSTTYELLDLSEHVLTFTTGEGPASAPAEPGVETFHVSGAPLDGWQSSCILGDTAAFVELEMAADPAVALYSVRRAGAAEGRWIEPAQLAASDEAHLDICGLGSLLQITDDTLCFDVAARNAAGAMSEYVQHCASVERCAPVSIDDEPTCQPVDEGDDDPVPDVEDDDGGGCNAAGGAAGWPIVILFMAWRRRRR